MKYDIEKILTMYEDDYNPGSTVLGPGNTKLVEILRSEMDNFNTPDLEQAPDSYLKPGETLEDFDVEFRRPNAQGGMQQLVQPNADGSRPGYAGKGDLTEGILKAYRDLGKGENTTTVDIYNKIKNLDIFKNYSRRDLLVMIGKRLRTNNKPYTKTTPATSDAFEETKQAKRKVYLDQPVKQPTPVYEVTKPGKPGKIINIKFPETGNNTKANFKKAINNYYSIPKDDAKIKVAKNKIIKDFFSRWVIRQPMEQTCRFF